ncbi:hypothetical protein PoB_006419500 [Plakobranchus ocellatus]|uniref:Uncharacterized protein n=1 Tax=Plakobranchus ocellatus TaxID=259542 RepID=A0AAV4D0N7_9GAST|nr:hypothetical protein PoB_006419500 [Plakobranchus ocellatus]
MNRRIAAKGRKQYRLLHPGVERQVKAIVKPSPFIPGSVLAHVEAKIPLKSAMLEFLARLEQALAWDQPVLCNSLPQL